MRLQEQKMSIIRAQRTHLECFDEASRTANDVAEVHKVHPTTGKATDDVGDATARTTAHLTNTALAERQAVVG